MTALVPVSGAVEIVKEARIAGLLATDPELAERFKTVVLSALTGNEKLMRCEPATLVQAIREAAMWGLEPDGVEAVIVPFWSSKRSRYEADFQPMARGYVTALYRSPRVTYVDADVIYDGDEFEYEKGATPRLFHRPKVFGDRGKPIGAYAVIKLDSGEMRPIVLNAEQIEKRQRVSRDSEAGAWADWTDEMWRKTALRSIISIAPVDRRVKQAVAIESAKYERVTAGPSVPQLPANATPVQEARAAFLPDAPAPAAGPVIDGQFTEQTAPEGEAGVEPSAAPASEVCGDEDASPMALGVCVLPVGHAGAHKNGDAGSWPARGRS